MKPLRWMLVLVFALFACPAFADGNVIAVVSGKTLTITGDAAANTVAVTPGGATDAFTVTPSAGTTLNGVATAGVFLHVHSITATMGAGNDRVDFTSVKVRGRVRVRLDDGNDAVYFTGTSIRGSVTVHGGAGTDTVRTDSAAIFYAPVSIRGEAGNDELQIVSAQFRNRLQVSAGGDDDHVLLQSLICTDTARVEVFAGHGLDLVEILFCQFANDVVAEMGPDNDRLRVAFSRFTLDLSAFGGLGEDDVLSIEAGNVFSRLKVFNGFEEGQPP